MKRWLLVLALVGAQTSVVRADSVAMTVPARRSGAPDVPALETFVFRPDSYRSNTPPRRLDPAKVGAYLAVMIAKQTDADEREFMKVRSLRAIRFFGGSLSDSEKKFLSSRQT